MFVLINISVWKGVYCLNQLILHVLLGRGQALIVTVLICEWERETEILQSLI